jgi:hypothetical protein
MKRALTLLAVLSLGGAATTFAQRAPKPVENAKAVLPVPRRLEALKAATKLLAPRVAAWSKNAPRLNDPFFRSSAPASTSTATVTASEQPAEKSDLEVLRSVAPEIKPTGTMLIGDEPYLLIGGRRLKVGDQITVTFEGVVYQVGLSSIERNSYTLRLNDQELQREFK